MTDDLTSNPPVTEPQIDPNEIVESVTSKVSETYDQKLKEIEAGVEERAEQKVSKLKEELLNNLSGQKEPKFEWEKKGRKDPESWDQLMSESERIAEEKFEKKMQEWQRRQEEESKKTETQRATEVQQKRAKFSQDWLDLVQKGKLPSPSEEIMTKLQKGERVTEQEAQSDVGLKEYRRLVKMALDNNEDLKIAYYERYNSEPAGMDAPVFGADRIHGRYETEENYSYEDIHSS